jgi:hypothetical protein
MGGSMTESERALATAMAKKFKELESTLHDRIESRNNMARSFFMPGTAVEIDTEPIAVAFKQFSENIQNEFLGVAEKFSEGLERSFSAAIEGLMSRLAERLMDKMDHLIEALATRPGITFSPNIQPSELRTIMQPAPEVKVDVQPAPVTVQQTHPPAIPVQFPERPKRTLRIHHSDGSESVIREE